MLICEICVICGLNSYLNTLTRLISYHSKNRTGFPMLISFPGNSFDFVFNGMIYSRK